MNVLRADGRDYAEMRPLQISMGVLTQYQGSSYIEVGGTKITCYVNIVESSDVYLEKATLKCFVSNHTEERKLSRILESALLPSIILTDYAKSIIHLHCTILFDDGSALSALINSCTCALIDAGIHLYDIVVASELAFNPIDNCKYLIDPTLSEAIEAQSTYLIAYMINTKRISHIEALGKITSLEDAMTWAYQHCTEISGLIRQAVQ